MPTDQADGVGLTLSFARSPDRYQLGNIIAELWMEDLRTCANLVTVAKDQRPLDRTGVPVGAFVAQA
ncbi:hypothetical protein HGI47_21690 [Novosphingobium sp. ERN07]|uniref:Uncharacterized protein n=1 Tax=Novosphingobium taihuense TaxID=260085 RepID=A0A7W7AGA3_9SPHN|nr:MULTISPECIES: hypothetical protein [Novosphingobium]MBB4615477.1 hypothetical protein [Novosphingobium taihuense]NLR73477.1 hypothetical protein [Novosphingobium sp. ERN07]TWH82077.1 hypothetical protein IQ25_03229 [Novosphingobium taihuense]